MPPPTAAAGASKSAHNKSAKKADAKSTRVHVKKLEALGSGSPAKKSRAAPAPVLVLRTPRDVTAARPELAHCERKRLPVLVLVHASWCGYCQQMKPEWQRAVDELAPRGMRTLSIELDALKSANDGGDEGGAPPVLSAVERDGPISGVPHIALLTPAGTVMRYDAFAAAADQPRDEYRTAASMLRFVLAGLKGAR